MIMQIPTLSQVTLANEKLNAINVLNAKGTILEKIKNQFIIHHYLDKYSFILNTF